MIECVPVTTYKLQFPEGKPMPLYMYYTLLGQEYETLRHDEGELVPDSDEASYALDVLETAINGHPEQEAVRCGDDTRVFNVNYNDGVSLDTRRVRVCFYIDPVDPVVLKCNVQRATQTHDSESNCTRTTYETGYRFMLEYEDLDWYGLMDDKTDACGEDEEW